MNKIFLNTGKTFLFILPVFFFLSLVVALDVNSPTTSSNVRGVTINIPAAPAFNNNTGAVNSSDFWDALDTPLDISRVGSSLGIGANPSYNLHVVGTAYFTGSTYPNFLYTLSSGTTASPVYSFNADPNTGMWNPTGDTLGFSTNGDEKLRINETGITMKSNLLEMVSSSGDIDFIMDNDAASSAEFRIRNGAGNNRVDFAMNGADYMSLSSAGSLSIGTVPDFSQKLTVDGNVTADYYFGNTLDLGNMVLTDGSITDAGGSISFGDEDLSTTGDMTAGSFIGNGSQLTDVCLQNGTGCDNAGDGTGGWTDGEPITTTNTNPVVIESDSFSYAVLKVLQSTVPPSQSYSQLDILQAIGADGAYDFAMPSGGGGDGGGVNFTLGDGGNADATNAGDGGSFEIKLGVKGSGSPDGSDGYLKLIGDQWMSRDNDEIVFGAGKDATIYWDGSNLIFNTNKTSSKAMAWFSYNVSATGYNTRTEVNEDANALESIPLASELLNPDGSINHTAFGDCYVEYEVSDRDRPVEVVVAEKVFIDEQGNPHPYNITETTYPFTKIEQAMSLTCMEAKERQALALLNRNVNLYNNLTDFDTGIMAEDIFTQSKVVQLGINYALKFLDVAGLTSKEFHKNKVVINDTNVPEDLREVLSLEDRTVDLEGAFMNHMECLANHKKYDDYRTCMGLTA